MKQYFATFKFRALLLSFFLGSSFSAIGLQSETEIEDAEIEKTAKEESQKWDVLNPPFDLSSLDIETDEVTWASLDITPDGKNMVFDTLGDLFIVDASGGKARALTQDFAWNIHPAVSPNGKKIAFSSDRGGLSNIWLMNIDGTDLKQVTKEKNNIMHSPKWSPDGQYILATKGIMSSRSIPAGEVWMYHHSGGEGIQIKARVNGKKDQKNIADPVFSPDGKYVYFTQDITSGSRFSYNRDPLKSIFAITRYDMEKGDEERFISGTGGAIVPTPSPDGKQLAFIKRIKNKTALFVKNLTDGSEKALYMDLERDMQEGFGSEGYFAYFDWTPDGTHLVFWTAGKFHKLEVKSGELSTIPVSLNTKMHYADAVRFDVDVAPDKFKVKMIRWAQKSPNGKTILFQALGKLYIKDVKSGKVKRLTKQNEHDEYFPRYSNDGKKIIYTTWNDQDLGSIRIVSASGGKGKAINKNPGHFVEPSFSLDGELVTYRKITGGYLLSPKWSVEPGIYVANLDEGTHTRVSQSGVAPHFAGNNERVYFTTVVGGTAYTETQLVSVDIHGEDKREHLYGADKVSEYRLSHDGKWIAFVHQYNAYVAPFMETGKRQNIGPTSTSVPVKQVSSRAGEYLTWHPNNKTLSWYHGPYYFERDLKDAYAFLPDSPETLPEPVTEGIDLSFEYQADKPSGYKALVGGNVVTMRDANNQQEVIQNGVIIIKGNRIESVGKAADVAIPEGAEVVDISGKTVIPGLIDTHAHGAQGSDEIIPQQNWSQYSNLAFGVTTIHDPSNDTTEIFSAAELQKAGKIVAPRIFSTGTILYGAEGLGYKAIIKSLDDAKYHLQRMKDVGAISVKSYNQPRRDQRQQVLAAARELGMMVVPEGGGKLQQNLTMLVDGHTGLEHSLPIEKGYNDLTALWAATEFGYTPTFVVSYGGLMGEEYWYDRTEVWKNERLMRYTPNFIVDRRSIRRPTAPDNQYNHFNVASYAKILRDKGVSVHIGAHGQREGLAAHWELWIMEQGGFTPWEALRGGTIDGAKHLGMDKQIGSIEAGKVADLVVIDGDVLSDLKRSEYVQYTVINGRIYDAATMNEVGSKKQRQAFFFEEDNQAFMPKETATKMHEKAKRHKWVH
ncbi:amidohydrolase family protein [Aliiglaciecola sp. LCG003]|uniref:amidohydrolase family protein n=1 Tax=Aliiglaciecola sp. LCG003 TaxID=3053655 RepID=UPI0025736400|nr:amidohydrolase family protein [Aliiglaciecola sp. LCG003]WJG09861.1 amidohydrolase family protein [Aliiglaciecola sp. LCG003]